MNEVHNLPPPLPLSTPLAILEPIRLELQPAPFGPEELLRVKRTKYSERGVHVSEWGFKT